MSWKRRIIELVLAGGTLVGCGNGSQVINNNFPPLDLSFNATCNANPDPCCADPNAPECLKDMGPRD